MDGIGLGFAGWHHYSQSINKHVDSMLPRCAERYLASASSILMRNRRNDTLLAFVIEVRVCGKDVFEAESHTLRGITVLAGACGNRANARYLW